VSDANPAPQQICSSLNITAETAGIAIICLFMPALDLLFALHQS
jgi:hypothetical protein